MIESGNDYADDYNGNQAHPKSTAEQKKLNSIAGNVQMKLKTEGGIAKEALNSMFQKRGLEPPIAEKFDQVDTNKNGKIEESEIPDALGVLDTNKNGQIEQSELTDREEG
jgi:hypothetical protein